MPNNEICLGASANHYTSFSQAIRSATRQFLRDNTCIKMHSRQRCAHKYLMEKPKYSWGEYIKFK